MILGFIVVSFVVLSFGLVVFFGAPYLPTLDKQAEQALDLLDLQPGETLLDLGSGDGTMLIRAAKRGIKSVGYELNPILFIFSWLRTRKYRRLVTVKCRNFWIVSWPTSDGVFVFLHTNFMQSLDKKLKLYAKSNGLRVVSFTFEIPHKKPIKRQKSLFLYTY